MLLPTISIKASSLYLSEIYCINLVKWIQRALILQTDMRLGTGDQMATHTGQGSRKHSSDIKRAGRRGIYHSEEEVRTKKEKFRIKTEEVSARDDSQ